MGKKKIYIKLEIMEKEQKGKLQKWDREGKCR